MWIKMQSFLVIIAAFIALKLNIAEGTAAPCYNTANHKAYVGRYDKTETGRNCQRWDSQKPHRHNNDNPTKFPDATLADTGNYCRDPDNDGVLWCYTTDPSKRFETCAMRRCSDSGSGSGCVNLTVGYTDVQQSSNYLNIAPARLAVDGIKTGDDGSSGTTQRMCSATEVGDFNPWWEVTLNETAPIRYIRITNRVDAVRCVNLAVGYTDVQQSSNYLNIAPARLAVDGIKTGDGGSSGTTQRMCSATEVGDFNPWWEVTLNETAPIRYIRITNRVDAVPERLRNIEIKAGICSAETLCGTFDGPADPKTLQYTIDCGKEIYADTIRISKTPLDDMDILTLCEVEIFKTSGV